MNINTLSRSKKRAVTLKKFSNQYRMKALQNAKASLAIEGMYITNHEEQLLLKRVNGKIKNSEFLSRAMEIAKNV